MRIKGSRGWIDWWVKDELEMAYLSGGTWEFQITGVSYCYTPFSELANHFCSKNVHLWLDVDIYLRLNQMLLVNPVQLI